MTQGHPLLYGLSVCTVCDAVSLKLEPVSCCLSLYQGVRFMSFLCLTAFSAGDFFPLRLHGRASGRDLYYHFFFPRSCPSPQGWMHWGPNDPPLYVPAVRFDVAHLHQSITHPHDEQGAAPVITCCGVTDQGKKLTSCVSF